MKHDMMEWHWQQPDDIEIICTSLQIDNNTDISSLNVYRPDALTDTWLTFFNY